MRQVGANPSAPYGEGMADQPINMSSGIPSTVLPDIDAALSGDLARAAGAPDARSAIADVVAANPTSLDGWAALGDHGRDVMDRYAAYRVGYHRGLDALRANGWRGSGYVRWSAVSNRGFLRCLLGLHLIADAIGESDEADRCAQFLLQLDPSGVPADQIAAVPAP
jgi:hypothetical protein